MDFNGQTASFEGNVTARQATKEIACQVMSVRFDRRIDFKQAREQRHRRQSPKAAIQHIDCDQAVKVYDVETENHQPDGMPVRYVSMSVVDLHYDHLSQTSFATGPGVIRIIEVLGTGPDDSGQTPKYPFSLSEISFRGSLHGDRPKHVVKCYDNVHILHTPVEDPQHPPDEDHLPEQGLTVEGEQVAVLLVEVGEQKFRNFTATDNVRVHAREFWGLCSRLSYDGLKKILVFEGDQSRPAQLWRQPHVGQKAEGPLPAKTIRYSLETKEIDFDRSGGFNILDVGSARSWPADIP